MSTEEKVWRLYQQGRITERDADAMLMFRELLERVGPPGINPQAERELLNEPQWREFLGVEAAK